MSHHVRTVVRMPSGSESNPGSRRGAHGMERPEWYRPEPGTVENLPTPGAMWDHYRWVPTLDGEPIRRHDRSRGSLENRKDAWAAAIKELGLRAGLAVEIQLGSQSGCIPDEWSSIVETVAEAREAILRHVLAEAQDHDGEPGTRGPGGRRATWEDLAEYEDSRRYDPNNPEAGMRCSYSLSETEWMEGVGGILWPVTDHRWATAPPEVWDHPADQPAGLDNGDDPDNHPEDDSDPG